jgi:hypothetical protein
VSDIWPSWDETPEAEERRDPAPPKAPIIPCRACLDTGVGFSLVYGFTSPCRSCRREQES